MAENNDHSWNGTNYYGASLASLGRLGRKKGYSLVATDSRGVNAFFVKDDLMIEGRFLDPAAHFHDSPPRYGAGPCGHPDGSGPIWRFRSSISQLTVWFGSLAPAIAVRLWLASLRPAVDGS